jgi:hypothetical protein
MEHPVRFLGLVTATAVFSLCGWAQSDKPDLTGNWQLDASKSEMQLNRFSDLKLTISEKDGKINITQAEKLPDGKERKVTYNCPTNGADCTVPETGAKASFWYNGPMLVNMETEKKGGSVIRERLKLSADNKALTMEISNLVPASDKVDKLVLEKQ